MTNEEWEEFYRKLWSEEARFNPDLTVAFIPGGAMFFQNPRPDLNCSRLREWEIRRDSETYGDKLWLQEIGIKG